MKSTALFLTVVFGCIAVVSCGRSEPKKVEFTVGYAELYTSSNVNTGVATMVRFVTADRTKYEANIANIVVACTGFVHGSPEITGTLGNNNEFNYLVNVVVDVKTPGEWLEWTSALKEMKPLVIFSGADPSSSP